MIHLSNFFFVSQHTLWHFNINIFLHFVYLTDLSSNKFLILCPPFVYISLSSPLLCHIEGKGDFIVIYNRIGQAIEALV